MKYRNILPIKGKVKPKPKKRGTKKWLKHLKGN